MIDESESTDALKTLVYSVNIPIPSGVDGNREALWHRI